MKRAKLRPPKYPIPNHIDVHLISPENYYRLVENVINHAQPVVNQSCDWLGFVPNPLIYPLIVYRQIERLRNADSSSRVE